MNSIGNIVKKLRESRESQLDENYIPVEYTYNGDEVSDYLGHVSVRTDLEDAALEAARAYAMEKHPEAEPRHFVIADTGYSNVDKIDEKGKLIDESKDLDEDSDDGNAEYKEFMKKCQENPTWKKANAICEKYGYKLSPIASVELYPSGRKVPSVNFITDRTKKYNPDVYFYAGKFGSTNPTMEIQTSAYGSLTLEEHAEFLESVTNAHKMVEELSKIDFMTLYQDEVDY